MKTMTCSQLGGPDGCDEKFTAEDFDGMAEQSKAHAMEMLASGDSAHMEKMQEMKELMTDPGAMKDWMEEKMKLFEELPES